MLNFQIYKYIKYFFSLLLLHQQLLKQMSLQFLSEKLILQNQEEPNSENTDNSEGNSSNLLKQNQSQTSNHHEFNQITRKPSLKKANIQSYKHLKRKSNQKIQEYMQQIKNHTPSKPLRLKRSSKQKLKQSKQSLQSGNSSSKATIQEVNMVKGYHYEHDNQQRKFKKQAMTKEEVHQMKKYIQRLQNEQQQVKSVAESQNILPHKAQSENKEHNKKSKTEYFRFQEFSNPSSNFISQYGENLTQLQILTLKNKCRTAIENNNRLQKKVSWLKQQIQMHLQRQSMLQKQKGMLLKYLSESKKQFQQKQHRLMKQNQDLQKTIQNKNNEIFILKSNKQLQKLQNLLISLHNKFSCQKQQLLEQIQVLKSQRQDKETQKYLIQQRKIDQLQRKVVQLLNNNQRQSDKQDDNYETNNNNRLINSLINENKYLKIQNHILIKCKQQNSTLKNRIKLLQNQNTRFKKLIIQNAKKCKKKSSQQQQEEEKQSNGSQLFTLSELSSLQGNQ